MSFASALILTPLLAFAAPAVAFLDEEPASGQQEPVSEPQDPAEMPVEPAGDTAEAGASPADSAAVQSTDAAIQTQLAATAPVPSAVNQEALESFVHAALISRSDLAKSPLEMLVSDSVSGEELATIVDQRGLSDRLDRAVVAMRADAELSVLAAQLMAKVEAGRNGLVRDPARIKLLVADLKGSMRQRSSAMRLLEQAGVYAMPALLKALAESGDAHHELLASQAMVAIGRNAVLPLCTALPDMPPAQQVKVCQVLGEIGWKVSAPALNALASDVKADEGSRDAATAALRRMGLTVSDPGPLWSNLARNCLTGGGVLLPYPQDPTQPLWRYDMHHGLMPTTVQTPAYLDVLAQAFAMKAMRADSANAAALATYLAAGLRLEAMQVEVAGAKIAPSNLVMLAGPSVAQQVLGVAVEIQDPGLQRQAIRALAATGGASSLVQGGPSAPLVACLDGSNQRVRLEAAIAIARANPSASFARSDAVVPLLAGALRSAGRPAAAVIAPQSEDRANFEQWLAARGFEVIASASDGEGLAQAMAGRGGAELIVIAGAPSDVSAAARRVRGTAVTAGSLVVLSVAEVDMSALDRALRDDRAATMWALGSSAESFTGAVDALMQRSGGGSLMEGEADMLAMQCADAFAGLGRAGGGPFRLADGQMALIEALGKQTGALRAKVAEALSWVPTQEAQRALLGAALAGVSGTPDEMQSSAVLLRAAAASARRFGDKADPSQVERLRASIAALASSTPPAEVPAEVVAELQAALAEGYGSLNLGPQQSIKQILD